jgi:hypothetical protein
MAHDPHREQQHDREQQKEQQLASFLLLSDEGDDGEEIIIPVDGNDSVLSLSSSPSNLEGASSSKDHNQKNPTTQVMKKQQEEEEKKEDKKVRVMSFRLSERDYERHLSMAKICHENGLTNKPDIVSYIRLSMECLSQYITSQAEAERSAEKKGGEQQQQLQIKKEVGSVEQHDLNNYHTMTASSSSSRATATTTTTNTAMGEQHTMESIARTPPSPPTPLFSLHEYFQPVFDEVDKLNKILDSHIEEEEKIINPKRKRNDDDDYRQ